MAVGTSSKASFILHSSVRLALVRLQARLSHCKVSIILMSTPGDLCTRHLYIRLSNTLHQFGIHLKNSKYRYLRLSKYKGKQLGTSLMTTVTGHQVRSPIWLTPYSGTVLLVDELKQVWYCMEIPLLNDSRLGERAIDWGKLFQIDIVFGKKENVYKSLLRKAARYVFNDYRDRWLGAVTNMIDTLQWDSPACRRTKASLILLYKINGG
jgi:hypothetical protein